MHRLRERPEVVLRTGLFCAFPFAMAGLVLQIGPLVAACGLVFVVLGLVLVADCGHVLARISARAVHDWTWRVNGRTRPRRVDGLVWVLVGAVWLYVGLFELGR